MVLGLALKGLYKLFMLPAKVHYWNEFIFDFLDSAGEWVMDVIDDYNDFAAILGWSPIAAPDNVWFTIPYVNISIDLMDIANGIADVYDWLWHAKRTVFKFLGNDLYTSIYNALDGISIPGTDELIFKDGATYQKGKLYNPVKKLNLSHVYDMVAMIHVLKTLFKLGKPFIKRFVHKIFGLFGWFNRNKMRRIAYGTLSRVDDINDDVLSLITDVEDLQGDVTALDGDLSALATAIANVTTEINENEDLIKAQPRYKPW